MSDKQFTIKVGKRRYAKVQVPQLSHIDFPDENDTLNNKILKMGAGALLAHYAETVYKHGLIKDTELTLTIRNGSELWWSQGGKFLEKIV